MSALAHSRFGKQSLVADDPPYLTFHLWLLISIASAFIFFIAAHSGGLAFVIENDKTYISEAIMIFFLTSSIFCGRRALRLSKELIAVQHLSRSKEEVESSAKVKDANKLVNQTWTGEILRESHANPERKETLMQALDDKLLGPHEVGWFITESLTKLGLLGTVIGFLIMLTALVGSNQLELSAMQSILRDMASGMGIKIIATVVGLLCNMILALQWLLLDRCAQKILSATKLQLGSPVVLPDVAIATAS